MTATRDVHGILAAAILCMGALCVGRADAADAVTLAREANTALRTAQSGVFNGKIDDAATALQKAEELVGELRAADPGNAQLVTLEQKCVKLRKDIGARTAKAGGPAAPAAAGAPSPGSPAADDSAASKLPPGAVFRLKEADRALTAADRAVSSPTAAMDWKVQSAKAGIEAARGKLEEIRQQFGERAPAGHADIRAVDARIADLEKKIAAAAAGAAAAQQGAQDTKAAEEQWQARLRPYVLGPGRQGHDPAKWMPASAPRALDELARALNLHREASEALAAFDKAGIPSPGDDLAESVRQLRYALKSFADSHRSFVEESLREATGQLDQLEGFLKEQEPKAAAGGDALPLEKSQVSTARARVELAAALVAAYDERVAALRGRLAGVERRDGALRKARVAQTRLIADRYSGGDLKELKGKAEQIVTAAQSGATVLRTTIISPDWKEESVIEATDTTHTALRFRTTRSVTAQVAARTQGEVKLHTVDLSRDRQANGSWGALYGHIMFTDPMLEENVRR